MSGEVKKSERPKFNEYGYNRRDYFLWYCRNRGKLQKLTEMQYGKIYREILDRITDEIKLGHRVNIPYLGYIQAFKYKYKVKIVDGKLVTNRPVDWKKTTKLYAKDPIAKEKHIVIRSEDDYGAMVIFAIHKQKNKMKYLKFKVMNKILADINNNLRDGIIDLELI